MLSRKIKTVRLRFTIFFAVAAFIVAACSPAPPAAAPTTVPEEPASAIPTPAQSQIQLALATSDFGVGENRLVFGVIDSVSGPLTTATVEVSSFRLTEMGQEGPVETQEAAYRKWPAVLRGVYTAELSFDKPGMWGIGAIVTQKDGTVSPASVKIDVKEKTSTPKIGAVAPRSVNKTLADVDGFEQITTDRNPDADLYSTTIADALDAGMPLLVVFSTPLYCQTATCGPQLEVIKDVKDRYKGQVNFIHVEIYDNPHEIDGDPVNKGKIAPALLEWGLPSEPWTFIVDKNGRIHAKFEAFTTEDEIEEALNEVL